MFDFGPEVARKKDREHSLIPVINVTFLLLLFFIVVGDFTESIAKKIFPPASRSTSTSDPAVAEFTLTREGALLWEDQVVTVASWGKQIADRGSKMPAMVRLRADAGTRAAMVMPVLDELKKLQVSRVTLVTVNDARRH
ncbi:MAG: ExbD/TolR family protein [Porticoccaceae bacterium]